MRVDGVDLGDAVLDGAELLELLELPWLVDPALELLLTGAAPVEDADSAEPSRANDGTGTVSGETAGPDAEQPRSATSTPNGSPGASLARCWPPPERQRQTTKMRIQRLREKVARLDHELRDARRRFREATQEQEQQRSATWEVVSVRQQRRREEAERENARLRRLVASQEQFLRRVQRLLSKRPNRAVRLLLPLLPADSLC